MLFIILVGFEIKFEKKLPMPLLAVAAAVVARRAFHLIHTFEAVSFAQDVAACMVDIVDVAADIVAGIAADIAVDIVAAVVVADASSVALPFVGKVEPFA